MKYKGYPNAVIGSTLSSSPFYKGSNEGSVDLILDGAFYWKNNNSILYWEGFQVNDAGMVGVT